MDPCSDGRGLSFKEECSQGQKDGPRKDGEPMPHAAHSSDAWMRNTGHHARGKQLAALGANIRDRKTKAKGQQPCLHVRLLARLPNLFLHVPPQEMVLVG